MHGALRRGLTGLALAVILAGCSSKPTRPASSFSGDDIFPRASPTRDYIAYQHIARASDDPRVTGLYVIHSDSTTSRRVLAGMFAGCDWIPFTDSLVVADSGLRVVSAATGLGRSLTAHEAHDPTVSPDGRLVAFDAFTGSVYHVFTADIATGAVVDISPDSMQYKNADWSRTGDQLIALGSSPWVSGIFVLGSDGAPIRPIVVGATGYLRGPVWSPTSDRIAWEEVDAHGTRIWVTDASGGNSTQVATGFVGLSWSRDGSELIYSLATPMGARLFALDPATQHARQITR